MTPRASDVAAQEGPRARWQAMTPGLDVLRRLAPTERAPLLLYVAYTIVLFVVFFAVTFPHELVVRRILARADATPLAIDVQGVHLGWPLAYTFDRVSLRRLNDDAGLPILTAAAVRAAPSLFGLLRGQPYPLAVRATICDGTLEGTVDLRPAAFSVNAALGNVDLGRYEGLRLFMEGTLRGRVDGTLDLRGDARKAATTTGSIDLRANGLAVEGGKVRGFTVPDLSFPEVHLAGAIKGGRLEVSELNANGREVTVRGAGNVLLQQPLAASLMNLQLALQPAADLADNLRLALNLIPGEVAASGERTVRLYGTLAQPRVGK